MKRISSILFAVIAGVAVLSYSPDASAGCPSPYPPQACKCVGGPTVGHICYITGPRPECTPCLYGCDTTGAGNDEPYAEDGIPLDAAQYKSCSFSTYDRYGLDFGTCDSGAFWWLCDANWCVDSTSTMFRPYDIELPATAQICE